MPCGNMLIKEYCDLGNFKLVDGIKNPHDDVNNYIFQTEQEHLKLINYTYNFTKNV